MKMQVTSPRRRRALDPHVPMINVVFLLLVFFMLTAQIVAPEPVELDAPTADLEPGARAEVTLFMAQNTTLTFETITGAEAVGAAAEQALVDDVPLHIKADKATPAVELARVLQQLATFEGIDLRIVTEPR